MGVASISFLGEFIGINRQRLKVIAFLNDKMLGTEHPTELLSHYKYQVKQLTKLEIKKLNSEVLQNLYGYVPEPTYSYLHLREYRKLCT